MLKRLKLRLKSFIFRFSKDNGGKLKQDKKVDKTIVILGMHRSGTSLTAGILSKLGINLGGSISNSAKDNPKGFFENVKFIELNDQILALGGGTWDNPPFYGKLLKLKKNDKIKSKIFSLIRSEEDTLWGWKDPRTNLTVDLYYPFLKNPFFIVCYRNPLSIAKSLNKRNNLSMEKSLNLISIYNYRISKFLSKVNNPILYLKYEDYFVDSKKEVARIRDFLNLPKNTNINDALGLIDKDLKHF